MVDKTKIKIWARTDGNPCNAGTGLMPMEEPVPSFPARAGDKVIKPKTDNNSIIVMGRDRNPFGPPKSKVPHGSEEDPNNPKSSKSQVSGFSDHQGAGAITITVGRGAPFPVEKLNHEIYPSGLPSLYTTRKPDFLATERLANGVSHPGYVMDAATIYMSQMCQIDDYFKIKKQKITLDKNRSPASQTDDLGPCSAIMIKADKVRMHSRRDVYIVAGGDADTTHDSNNNRINESGRIHLVSKNGNDPSVRPQSPAVRYNELKDCLLDITKSLKSLGNIVNTNLLSQKLLNFRLANSIVGTAVGMSTQDPLAQAANQVKSLSDMAELLQIHAELTTNINLVEANFLFESGQGSIASRHVTLS